MPLIIVLLLIAILDGTLIYLAVVQHAEYIYRENSWIENMQVGFLFIAFLLFISASFRTARHHRNLCGFFASLSFIFMLREVDIEKFDVPQWQIFLFAEQGRAVFYAISFGLLFMELGKYSYYLKNRHHFIASNLFRFMAMAAVLLIVFSTAFDQKLIKMNHRIFFEELSEITAYCFIVAAAFLAKKELDVIDGAIEPKESTA